MNKAPIYSVGVIVINFNRPIETIRCLRSVEKYLSGELKIFFYDNSAYRDHSLYDFISETSLDINCYENFANAGFVGGVNWGVSQALSASCDFILLLNNDTELVDNCINRGVDVLRKNKDLGVLGFKNFYSDRPSVLWQAGGRKRFFSLGFREVLIDLNSNITVCDYVPGSSMLIRASLFEDIGLFDEKFFAYFEEIDFCLRARNVGVLTAVLNDSKILHDVGLSSNSRLKVFLKSRNRPYFLAKHNQSNIRILVSILVYGIFEALRSFLRLDFIYFLYSVRGVLAFLKNDMYKPNLYKGFK